MDNLLKRMGLIVPFIMMLVSVDQWSAATGAADPFQPFGVPIASAARGIGLVLAGSFILYHVRELWKSQNKSVGRLRLVLGVLFGIILIAEIMVIAPYLVASMRDTATAKMFDAWRPNGARIGTALYVAWCVAISVIPLLAVGATALATVFADEAGAKLERIAPQTKTDAKDNANVCAQCGAICKNQNALAAHMRWKHPTPNASGNGNGKKESVNANATN